MKLEIGTRIYNSGDMANLPHHGTITNIETGRFGTQLEITPDPESERRVYWIPPCMFSPKYEGHGGTRIVTEAAYMEWKYERIAEFKQRHGGQK